MDCVLLTKTFKYFHYDSVIKKEVKSNQGLPHMVTNTKQVVLWVLLLLVAIPVVSADIINLDVNPSQITLDLLQNQVTSFNITLSNTGASNSTVSFSNAAIKDNDDDKILFSLPSGMTILQSSTQTAKIGLDVDGSMDIGTYTGQLAIKDTVTNETETVSLTFKVTPGVCSFGQKGTSLKLDIKSPDSGDDYSPGDTIKIEAKVDNDGTDNIRTQVEAFLFNENDIIESAAAKDENIENNEDQTFTFSLNIPTLNTNIDEKEDFILYLKAFDDDDEKSECIQNSVAIDIKLKSNKVGIKDSTRFLSPVIACGGQASLIVDVINLGKDDEDVKIQVENKELGIFETSDTFNIENFNADEKNEGSRTFNFDIPDGIKEKVYNFGIKALFSGETESTTLPLDVVSCGPSSDFDFPIDYVSATLAIQGNKIVKLNVKGTTTIHTLIENNAPEKRIFFVTLGEVSEFAEGSSATVTVDAFKSANVFLPLSVLATAEEGTYSATVKVSEGVKTLASDTVTIKIESAQPTEEVSSSSFIYDLSKGELVGLNFALLVLILVIIYLLKRI